MLPCREGRRRRHESQSKDRFFSFFFRPWGECLGDGAWVENFTADGGFEGFVRQVLPRDSSPWTPRTRPARWTQPPWSHRGTHRELFRVELGSSTAGLGGGTQRLGP